MRISKTINMNFKKYPCFRRKKSTHKNFNPEGQEPKLHAGQQERRRTSNVSPVTSLSFSSIITLLPIHHFARKWEHCLGMTKEKEEHKAMSKEDSMMRSMSSEQLDLFINIEPWRSMKLVWSWTITLRRKWFQKRRTVLGRWKRGLERKKNCWKS